MPPAEVLRPGLTRLALAGLGLAASWLVPFAAWAAPWFSELRGSYRNLPFVEEQPVGHARGADLNRLRLEWDAATGSLRLHLAYDHELLAGGLVNTPAFRAAVSRPYPTWADADARLLQKGAVYWRHRLYRGWVSLDEGKALIKIGRQRVAWGTGRLWNPTDRFNPVDPAVLEPDEKTGVDGLLAELRYSASGALQWAAGPGRGARGVPRRSVLRLRDTVGGVDVSALIGRIGEETVLGGDFAADVRDGGLHAEALFSRPAQGASWTQVSAGYEYTLTNRWLPSGLYLLAEYFFNGAAGRSAAPAPGDRLSSRVRHLAGFAAGYDLTPLWRLETTVIADAVKGSAFISPRLKWSVAEDVDLTALTLWFTGATGSEFGDRGNVWALQLDAWF